MFPPTDRKKDSSLELLVHGLHLTKTDLKKMEKLTKINIHLHGELDRAIRTPTDVKLT